MTAANDASDQAVAPTTLSISPQRWSFAGDTPAGFDDHAERSIPEYIEGHRVVTRLSRAFIAPNSRIVDVGSSTGTLLAGMASASNALSTVSYEGYDIEAQMVLLARQRHAGIRNLSFDVGDAAEIDYSRSSVVVMYYTLQFVPRETRTRIVQRIYEGLRPGGVFFLFEKVLAEDARQQDAITQAYAEFKIEQGYTGQEIFDKTKSLQSVLFCQSAEENRDMLRRAGFDSIIAVFRNLSFEGVMAIK